MRPNLRVIDCGLTPPDCDLRDFGYMPLDVRRLLTSDTWLEAADDPKLGHVLICLWRNPGIKSRRDRCRTMIECSPVSPCATARNGVGSASGR